MQYLFVPLSSLREHARARSPKPDKPMINIKQGPGCIFSSSSHSCKISLDSCKKDVERRLLSGRRLWVLRHGRRRHPVSVRNARRGVLFRGEHEEEPREEDTKEDLSVLRLLPGKSVFDTRFKRIPPPPLISPLFSFFLLKME